MEVSFFAEIRDAVMWVARDPISAVSFSKLPLSSNSRGGRVDCSPWRIMSTPEAWSPTCDSRDTHVHH